MKFSKEELRNIKKRLRYWINNTHKPIRQILKELNIKPSYAYNHPELFKIIQMRKTKTDIIRENIDLIISKLSAGYTYKQIAIELGINPYDLYNYRRLYGIYKNSANQ